MITYEENVDFSDQILEETKKLEELKSSYDKKLDLYNRLLNSSILALNSNIRRIISTTIDAIIEQIYKIDKNLVVLEEFSISEVQRYDVLKYNKEFNEINQIFIKNHIIEKEIVNYLAKKYNLDTVALSKTEPVNSVSESEEKIENESTTVLSNNDLDYYANKTFADINATADVVIDKNLYFNTDAVSSENNEEIEVEIDDDRVNDTLVISEITGKVLFPYTAIEILQTMENERYRTIEEAVEKRFTRPLSDFRFQFISRYRETLKLVVEKEGYSLLDAVSLATEMMKKRYLHPAIIAACKNIDELDVYLDCLDKGELDDFKIFNIKYELYPLVVKENNIISNFKKLFEGKKGKKEGKHARS